ncbi:MAG: peptidoglycan-associated lipoprotein Pal [Gammaproteobacteria bacterium]|nr:peptidoglycan-associated lipoprotein Pal [Gammaproteobacteria bacterium]
MSALKQQISINKTNIKDFLKRGVFLIIPAVVLLGCESTPEQPDTDAASEPVKVVDSSASTSAADQGDSSAVKPMVEPQIDPLDDPNSLLSNRTVYFDFDRNDINDEYRAIIRAHAEYLANNPSSRITIEGNADERGTREYNIGLGDRRASAVRQLMVLQGATSGQVETISYGEERPADPGHDEAAWDKNRRAEIVYSAR